MLHPPYVAATMLQDVAKQFLTLFAIKVRHFNLQTNSKLAYDLPTLLQLFSSPSNVCYPDHHPYTEIKKEILQHLRILQRKQHVEDCDRRRKSINLAKIHYTKLQTIRVDDVFTCVFQSQLLEFRVLEITPSASIRLLLQSQSRISSGILSPSRTDTSPRPCGTSSGILSSPNGFIVRVSQKGLYKLRIGKIQVEFIHRLTESYQAWLWIMKSHPLFSYEALRLPWTDTTVVTAIKNTK